MIRQGDALKLIKKVKSKSVSLAIIDPPYDVSRESNLHTLSRGPISWDWDTDVGFSWLRDVERVLAPGGAVVVFHKWQALGDLAAGLERCGLAVKDRLTWIKTNPRRLNQKRRFLADVENMVWAVKPPSKWDFNGDGVSSCFWYPIRRSWHPCAKPVGLIEDLVGLLSTPGGCVLDPFAGSGVVRQVCLQLGRRYVGFELNLEYFQRIESEKR